MTNISGNIATPTSSQRFLKQVELHNLAAIGVVFIRTSEPFDAIDAIQAQSLAKKKEYREWSATEGWQKLDLTHPEVPVVDNDVATAPLAPALKRMMGGVDDDELCPDQCYYVMLWPHHFLDGYPISLLQTAIASVQLTYAKRRLYMIVPQGFTPPTDIAQMVPIIDHGLPDQVELRGVYTNLMDGTKESLTDYTKTFTEQNVDAICAAGAGMTRKEFENACAIATIKARDRDDNTPESFRLSVMQTKTEVVRRSEVLEVMPTVSMDQVGGLDVLKDWIDDRKHALTEEAYAAGVDTPNGIALIGPPGTGKSLGAKAIGAALGLPIIRMDIARAFGSLVGESESRVTAALAMLDAMAPCVGFVDEIDKVFDMNSGGGDSGVGKRVLGKVLTHMQESNKTIFWVVTANRTQGLPPELLRKGRLDELFSVTTPNADERRAILSIHLRKRKQDPAAVEGLEQAVNTTDGYVGAEIEAAVKDAVLRGYIDNVPVTGAMITKAAKAMTPLSVSFKEQFDEMANWARDNARAASLKVDDKPTRTRTRSRGGRAMGEGE